MDEVQITTVYANQRVCMLEFAAASERLIALRGRIEETRLGAIRDGLITGKNEDERKACAKELMKDLYEELAQAESAERHAKYRLDAAANSVEEARALLRLAEIKAGINHVRN